MPTRIESVEQLKDAASGGCECFIALMGCLRSSKYIHYDESDNTFAVINYIDGSEEVLSEEQLLDKDYSNIGVAMKRGALFLDD